MTIRENLAVVVPCYNEQESIHTFTEIMWPILNRIEYERGLDCRIIFIDDGSLDGTLEAIKFESGSNSKNEYISFSRNFGKEAALYAGLNKSIQEGADYVLIMDVDLQDPPSLIPEMFFTMDQTGSDVVATFRRTREGEPRVRSWFAEQFYKLINKLSDIEIKNGSRDYRLMKSMVVRAVLSMPETERFSKGLFSWVGFKVEWIGYDNVERTQGSTHWSFLTLLWYALDGIIAFSTKPLIGVSITGLLFCALSVLFLLFIIIRAVLFGDPVAGWPSLVSVISLFSGLNLLGIGIVGMYTSKIYAESKRRPNYIIREESLN